MLLRNTIIYCFIFESEVFFLYKTCVTCPKLGISCDGANLITMPAAELLEWCKLRKKHLGWSNAYLSEQSLVPKGTIDRLFSADPTDFRHETLRPIVTALVGGKPGSNPCPDPFDLSAAHLREIIDIQKADINDLNQRLQAGKLAHDNDVEYYRRQHREQRKINVVLGVALVVLLAVVAGLFAYDALNPNIGWFRY